jgi:hypothetical protein
MPTLSPHVLHARALRADLLASPTIWLPRREILLEWLSEFLTRAQDSRYVFETAETTDLDALDRFLRKNHVPVAG